MTALLPPADPWAAYARTRVEIARGAEGDFVTVCAAPLGQKGRWPWPTRDPVPILTAWDPGEERPGMDVNRRRGSELEAALRPRARRVLDAVGVDPATGRREEGLAALGLPVEEAVAFGARLSPGRHFRVGPARLVHRVVPGRAPGRLRLVSSLTTYNVVVSRAWHDATQ